jgi:Ca2+-binding RTX toxin-like protein
MGDDTIYGNRGNGRIRGGEGDDLIFGESGNDKLFGGPDDDSLTGGPGIDTFNCGDGDDAVTDYNPAKNETISANCENIINVTDDIAINIPTNIAEQTADNISISPFNLSLLEDEDDDVGVEKEEEEEIVTEG